VSPRSINEENTGTKEAERAPSLRRLRKAFGILSAAA